MQHTALFCRGCVVRGNWALGGELSPYQPLEVIGLALLEGFPDA